MNAITERANYQRLLVGLQAVEAEAINLMYTHYFIQRRLTPNESYILCQAAIPKAKASQNFCDTIYQMIKSGQ